MFKVSNLRGKSMNVNRRKLSREHMMKVIFQIEARNDFQGSDREIYFEDNGKKLEKEYCEKMYENFLTNHDCIDENIKKYSTEWDITRIAKIDLSILRLAIAEILFFPDIDVAVTINEAVNLAKLYGAENSPAFVNAVLGSIAKERRE